MRKFTILLAFAFLSACAHKPGTTQTAGAGDNSDSAVHDNVTSFKVSDVSEPAPSDQELENIPVEVNTLVDKWITYFQGKGRHHMEKYLARSTRYEKLMKKVLRDNGLPEDLFYIALIESGFTSHATSHASAVGYWQFIRGTGKRYGLDINKFVDERRDPVLATQAAADYFKGLYSVFGSWYLAMASYNAGENRIQRVVMENATRDFWELAKKKLLPEETINYVPKFIAAKLIAKNPEKYGFNDIDYLPAVEFDTIVIKFPVNLRTMADKLDYNYEDFKALNPRFKGEIAPVSGDGLHLRIPPGSHDRAIAAANDSKTDKVVYIADQGDSTNYKIRRGDTLAGIAHHFRTTVAYLRDLNDLPRGKKLKVGSMLVVPDHTPLRDRSRTKSAERDAVASVAASSDASVAKTAGVTTEGGYHIVQSGESLFTIAKKYNTTVSELQKINNIKRGKSLKIGIKLKLPGGDNPDAPKSMNSSAKKVSKTTRLAANLKSKKKRRKQRAVASDRS